MEIKPEVLMQNKVEEDGKVPLDYGSEGGDVRSNHEDEKVDVQDVNTNEELDKG